MAGLRRVIVEFRSFRVSFQVVIVLFAFAQDDGGHVSRKEKAEPNSRLDFRILIGFLSR